MAFGKIIVQTESGEYWEVELTKPTTSVGRQPGNDIVLPTAAVSRYHAQFDVAEGQVFLVDLGTVNGTFVNDVQVEPNSRVALSDGDRIAMGDVMLLFRSPEARSLKSIELMPTSIPLEDPAVPFRLVLDAPQQPVAPTARLQLKLLIENLGEQPATYTIETGGLERSWVKVNHREIRLDPGESAEVVISIRPPRSSQTRPGLYALTVRVALKDDPAQALEAVREIEIVGYAAMAMAIQEGQQNGIYHIAIQNQGSLPLNLRLGGYQPQRLLQYHFDPAQVSLQPGETAQVKLTVRPRRSQLFGPTRTVNFAIVARSLDATGYQAPIGATYTLKPSWPAWVAGAALPLLLGGGVLAAVLVAALFLFGVLPFGKGAAPEEGEVTGGVAEEVVVATATLPAPTPSLIPTPAAEIIEFSAQPEEVIFRTEGNVALVWLAEGAVSVALFDELDRQLPLTADNLSTGRYEIPIASLDWGEHTYQLTVMGEDRVRRSETASVMVRSVVCERASEEFEAFTRPSPLASPAPPFESNQLVVIGRSPDALWLRVGYNNLSAPEWDAEGWMSRDWVLCPPDSPPFEQYVVLGEEGQLPPPAVESAPATPDRGNNGPSSGGAADSPVDDG